MTKFMSKQYTIIEINTFEDLMDLIAKEDRIIIEEDTILVYDAYLE